MSIKSGYSDYEGQRVIDSNQLEVGKIVDFTMDPETYKLHHFVVEGDNSVLKEHHQIMSKYKLLVPHETIRRRSKDGEVILAEEAASFEHISEIPPNLVRLSSIRSADVIARDQEDVGRVIDALIHSDNKVSLILGGSPFQEFMSRIGLRENMHLLLPYRYIEKMNSNIVIMEKNRDDLVKVLNDVVLDSDGKRLMDERNKASKESRLLLYKESYKDVFQGNEKTSY